MKSTEILVMAASIAAHVTAQRAASGAKPDDFTVQEVDALWLAALALYGPYAAIRFQALSVNVARSDL